MVYAFVDDMMITSANLVLRIWTTMMMMMVTDYESKDHRKVVKTQQRRNRNVKCHNLWCTQFPHSIAGTLRHVGDKFAQKISHIIDRKMHQINCPAKFLVFLCVIFARKSDECHASTQRDRDNNRCRCEKTFFLLQFSTPKKQ